MTRDKLTDYDAHRCKMIWILSQDRATILIHPMTQEIDFVLIITAINQRVFLRIR